MYALQRISLSHISELLKINVTCTTPTKHLYSDILLFCEENHSQGRQVARLILFYKIIDGLAQVPYEGFLVEAYKGTRRKCNMKFRQICHTTSQYGQ